MSMVPLGTRWVKDKMEHSEEMERQDVAASKSQEEITMQCVQGAANSIVSWLDFTIDLPEYHESGTDLRVWVQHPLPEEETEGLGADLIMWEFYEKETAANRVLRALSAFTCRCKLTTLAMETFRRMRNSSRQMTVEARTMIIYRFTERLRRSGYSQKTVSGILESGLKYYYRKVRVDLEEVRWGRTWCGLPGGEGAAEREKKENGWRTEMPKVTGVPGKEREKSQETAGVKETEGKDRREVITVYTFGPLHQGLAPAEENPDSGR